MSANIDWSPDTISVSGVGYRIAKTPSDNELKRSMVERGMSAGEIERVMAARTPNSVKRASAFVTPAG